MSRTEEHGKRATYMGGCRCQECKKGHAAYMAQYRERKPKTGRGKHYSRVVTTEPPLTAGDWLDLEDPDQFWFWFALMHCEDAELVLPH